MLEPDRCVFSNKLDLFWPFNIFYLGNLQLLVDK